MKSFAQSACISRWPLVFFFSHLLFHYILMLTLGTRLHATTEKPTIASAALKHTTIVSVSHDKDTVDVRFADDCSFRFHTLWLRDACRDEQFVKTAAGEKILGWNHFVHTFIQSRAWCACDHGTIPIFPWPPRIRSLVRSFIETLFPPMSHVNVWSDFTNSDHRVRGLSRKNNNCQFWSAHQGFLDLC